jgi:hypothetical protein
VRVHAKVRPHYSSHRPTRTDGGHR